ncbi:hypothetical protein [Wansuia hejianensis]|uniref:Uncharacterized protein n=1 Tax=Wansuia hejianensis TaxID=2763667 RepID=A0A926EZM0_9FIRM|nr:hypothetical protein [Wansuia hejianensis]MBC8590601.1 hypothetical protein [Wansuia hejianensis]
MSEKTRILSTMTYRYTSWSPSAGTRTLYRIRLNTFRLHDLGNGDFKLSFKPTFIAGDWPSLASVPTSKRLRISIGGLWLSYNVTLKTFYIRDSVGTTVETDVFNAASFNSEYIKTDRGRISYIHLGLWDNEGSVDDNVDSIYTFKIFPDLKMKVNGVLRTSEDGWVKVNGQLRQIESIYIKINGSLKEV